MRVLIVGSGAVAQVLGLHLQAAGVELGFFARPESADRLKRALQQGGLPLFQTSHFRKRNPIAHRLENYQVETDMAGSQQFHPDQIWFTTPSTVYYTKWFQEFLEKVPAETVVCFAPEGGREEFISQIVNQDRLVFGGITFIAWQGGPDGGGGQPDGINFWLPPFIEIPLLGSEDACREIAELLKIGGFRASIKKPNFHKSQAAVTGVMTAFVAGLELSGWSFRAFRRSPWLKHAAHGAKEAALSQLDRAGILNRSLLGLLFSTTSFFLATTILPLLFPFNLEKYMKFHYSKTREQSLSLLEIFIKDGEDKGISVDNIQTLRMRLLDPA